MIQFPPDLPRHRKSAVQSLGVKVFETVWLAATPA
jgi:hypothetical protein